MAAAELRWCVSVPSRKAKGIKDDLRSRGWLDRTLKVLIRYALRRCARGKGRGCHRRVVKLMHPAAGPWHKRRPRPRASHLAPTPVSRRMHAHLHAHARSCTRACAHTRRSLTAGGQSACFRSRRTSTLRSSRHSFRL